MTVHTNYIKPCPFCGSGISLIRKDQLWYFRCNQYHYFLFDGMNENVLPMDTLERAIFEFNRRVSE